MLGQIVATAPGLAIRAAGGAWHIPGGLAFLARRLRLWPLAVLPMFLAAGLVVGGFLLGLYVGPSIESVLLRRFGRLPEWLDAPLTLTVWLTTVVAGVLAGLAVALLFAAPVLDRLSRKVEATARGEAIDAGASLRWEVAQSLRGAVYFVSRMPAILIVGFVPMVGPAMSVLWAAHCLAFQNTDPALARRGLGFAERRAWHRRHRPESLGFGLASLACLLVPCAGLLMIPALVTGGTLLVLELADSPPPA
jgi:CysZ protein